MIYRGDLDLYVGFDESNHGKYPEIIVATFSRDSSMILESTIPKQRNHPASFLENLSCDYTFLLNPTEWKESNYSYLMANIVGCLIKPKINFNDTVRILIDGEIKHSSDKEMNHLKKNIADIAEIHKSRLSLKFGPDFDRTYPLVNLADEIAHYIFRKLTPEKIAENSHLVELLR